jgi:hypothetical protein
LRDLMAGDREGNLSDTIQYFAVIVIAKLSSLSCDFHAASKPLKDQSSAGPLAYPRLRIRAAVQR